MIFNAALSGRLAPKMLNLARKRLYGACVIYEEISRTQR
jgi:hypothetical protein